VGGLVGLALLAFNCWTCAIVMSRNWKDGLKFPWKNFLLTEKSHQSQHPLDAQLQVSIENFRDNQTQQQQRQKKSCYNLILSLLLVFMKFFYDSKIRKDYKGIGFGNDTIYNTNNVSTSALRTHTHTHLINSPRWGLLLLACLLAKQTAFCHSRSLFFWKKFPSA